ncbi:PREDICTED: thyroid receptor-interacting protein 11-like [Ceratosolen solmsi marchali]|uniref:Thyroid receptor-interacting protein 11-like n=1 Tax=Ceratosolen solmsi marchali TaxID=326594 RepID=A0AAJ6YM08_9HYME|nr:PREDICTED: thyroid receptor-interacting protein 11-like [Ceratosolen solmsi marchali]
MSWLNDGLSPAILTHLKGQIKNFTQEVLSDGIISETDDRSNNLEQTNEECDRLQALLNSKDEIISVLRKQNSELQRDAHEFRTKANNSANNGSGLEEEENDGAFFWDPPPKNRDAKTQTKMLQEQLGQATLRIHELQLQLDSLRKLNSSNAKDDANFKDEGPSAEKSEALRAKQDLTNSVIQSNEKLSDGEKSDSEEFDERGKLHCTRDKMQMRAAQDRENELRLKIDELEAENENLSMSMEELDKQNAVNLERVLAIKEEIQRKHQSLQSAYECLYVEHNEALSKLDNLQYRKEEQEEELVKLQRSLIKETSDSIVQTAGLSKIDQGTEMYLNLEDKQTEVDLEVDQNLSIEAEIKKVVDILDNVSFKIASDNKSQSIFISLAKEFVDLKLRYEALECQFIKQNTELTEMQQVRKSMEMDRENMQEKIETSCTEMERTKDLPYQLKASEGRVFSLEKEIECLEERNRALHQSELDVYTRLDSVEIVSQESDNVDISKSVVRSEGKLISGEIKDTDDFLRADFDENTKLNYTIEILKSQLEESSKIIDIMEKMKLEIECANQQIDKAPIHSEMNNVSEITNSGGDTSEMKDTKDLLVTLMNLYEKIDSNIIRWKSIDTKCQKVIADVEERQEIISNENRTANNTTMYTDDYVSSLENEIKVLRDALPTIECLQEENKKANEEIERYCAREKLRDAEINAHKELIVKYQTELEQLKTVGDENQSLRLKLNKLSVEKCDAEVNTDSLETEDTRIDDPSLTHKEHLQLLSEMSEKSKEIESLRATVARDKESALMARETVENLSQLISSKDEEIIKINSSFNTLNNEREELIKLVQEKHNESLKYHSEIQRLTQLLHEQTTKLQKLNAENDASLATLQEKEEQLLWAQNELQVIKQRLQNIEKSNNYEDRCGIADHTLLSNQVSSLEEKNKVMEAAIIQDQANIRYLQMQLTESQSKEAIALKEVERLRNHLVEMEANYMEEALQSEEIQKKLESRLMQVEETLKNSSTMYTSASIRANQQVETLQQQLALIVQQRDDLQNKISFADDKVLSYTASLTNLQLVLEQFQRDKEKDIQIAKEKLHAQLQDSFKRQEDLSNEITNLRDQLTEAKECLCAASRLTDQLERKSERIEQLNQEVNRLTELVNTADQRIESANKSGEGKVDRSLVKNLLLGYISSPSNDKISVLRVFANVLDFNETERGNCGLNGATVKNGWFSAVTNNSPSTSNKGQDTSLSSAFVKFLESESQPKPQLPALPISNSAIGRPAHSRQHSSSSTQSTLLLSNVTLPTFPDFVPARNTGSILKEVLKDS